MNIFKKGVLATTLAASALVASVSPAAAQDYRDYRNGRDNTAAVAIGAGILGLAVGAIAASGNNDRYRDGRYYDRQYYSNDSWNYRNGQNFDRSRRYDRRDRRGDDWRNGSSRGNDWRRGDRQRSDDRYYGRRGY